MKEKALTTERFDSLVDMAAKEARYEEGFGVKGCDLTNSCWWAAYTRQSWEEQANNNRLPEYLLTCAKEAKKLGVVVPLEYILYDTVTGEHLERPDMIRLRKLLTKRLISGVIFPALDRLSREPLHQQIFELEATHYEIQIHYADVPNGNDPNSQFTRTILAHAAKLVKLANRRNNRGGNIGRVVSGNVPAGKPSYGYIYRAEYQALEHGRRKLIRAWWEINALEADGTYKIGSEAWVVKEIFRWIGLEGRSTFWVAEELNRMRIKPRYAEKWSPALVGFICKNRAYTGKHAYNKACYVTNPNRPLTDITAEIKRTLRKAKPEDDWAHFEVPLLVSEELWQRANDNIHERGKGRGKAGKSIPALFRARVFCPKCGHIMRLHRDSTCSWLTYYVCRTQGCSMKFIRVSHLDDIGWENVAAILQDHSFIDAKAENTSRDDGGIQKRIRLELFQKREAERKIARIQDDLLSDEPVITRQEAVAKIGELRKVVEKTDTEIARLQGIVQTAKQAEEKIEALKKALEDSRDINLNTATFQQKAEWIARLGVKVYPAKDLTNYHIKCGIKITEPQKVSCYKTSIASPKL
ncbi:Site-specific recombinase [Dehalococcoides mccartyi]|uniref:Site-specific recombinase n=1 Tax=Dehalococcoides mccartyi TaxID=61435 RepID=A0AB33HY36_9CHLR|nr:recombinase family protein [Dehalococcoides mccartyi]MEA4879246.1 recombinase family protein [Dehalococcoides mccartyi]BAZ97297.1 Site-specific recombinase [Dehalococcoides mccartyi]